MARLRTRALPVALLLAAAIPLSAGCEDVPGFSGDEPPDTATLLLLDMSGEVDPETTGERYMEIVDQVLEETSGAFAVDTIDDNPLGNDGLPVNEVIEPFDSLADNQLAYEQEAEGLRDSINELVMNDEPSGGAAILDSLLAAQDYFDNWSEAETKRLVIVSDMIETSDRISSNRAMNEETRQAFIEKDRASGDLPELDGVKVWVAGAGVNEAEGIKANYNRRITDFWLDYLAATGADASDERFGPTLVRYP